MLILYNYNFGAMPASRAAQPALSRRQLLQPLQLSREPAIMAASNFNFARQLSAVVQHGEHSQQQAPMYSVASSALPAQHSSDSVLSGASTPDWQAAAGEDGVQVERRAQAAQATAAAQPAAVGNASRGAAQSLQDLRDGCESELSILREGRLSKEAGRPQVHLPAGHVLVTALLEGIADILFDKQVSLALSSRRGPHGAEPTCAHCQDGMAMLSAAWRQHGAAASRCSTPLSRTPGARLRAYKRRRQRHLKLRMFAPFWRESRPQHSVWRSSGGKQAHRTPWRNFAPISSSIRKHYRASARTSGTAGSRRVGVKIVRR
jgi:hypothetical protein